MGRNPVDLLRSATLVLALASLAAASASTAPRSIGDCEQIKDPDAYNQCLASFGPVAHIGPAVGETPATSGAEAVLPQAAQRGSVRAHGKRSAHGPRGDRRGHAGLVTSRHGGRVRATFFVRQR